MKKPLLNVHEYPGYSWSLADGIRVFHIDSGYKALHQNKHDVRAFGSVVAARTDSFCRGKLPSERASVLFSRAEDNLRAS
jgi:hypothetical protein